MLVVYPGSLSFLKKMLKVRHFARDMPYQTTSEHEPVFSYLQVSFKVWLTVCDAPANLKTQYINNIYNNYCSPKQNA